MNTANYKEMMAELRTEYLEAFQQKFQTINDFFDQKDWYSIELEYHKLKGTGSTYGVPEVTQLCEQLERVCREKKQIERIVVDQSIELLTAIREKYLNDKEFDLSSNATFLSIKNL